MLSHLRGLLAFSFSLKVVRRPAIAELNPLAAFSENGTVNDVSPIWNVIGAVACAWVEQTGVPRRTFLSTTAEVERDTDLREKDKEVEEKEEEEEEEDAEEEETKRAEEEKGEAPMARTEEEEETMADPIAKTSPTTTKQTPKRMQPTDWSWDKDKLQKIGTYQMITLLLRELLIGNTNK
jgi:hypothetical protein